MKRLFINGRIYTFDPTRPVAEAVLIENGCFMDIGNTVELRQRWGDELDIVDLKGKTVTPGLIDSHLHLSLIANSFLELDLTGVTSKFDMLEKIKHKANSLQPGEWLLGSGWDENLFEDGRFPSIQELDVVAPQNPIFLSRVCLHAALVNSRALKISQYHQGIRVPEGGEIVLDPVSHNPTGLLLETATELIKKYIPEKSYAQLKYAMKKAMQYAISLGITSVHTNDPFYLGGLEQTYQIYDELLNKDNIGLRCNLLINHEFIDDIRKMGMYAGYGNDTLKIGAIKIFADGAFGRRTALLSEAYTDAPNEFGNAIFEQTTLYEIVRKARELSMPIAVHVIGDQALENVLDVLDQFPTAAYRDRLIHVQVVREELIGRLAVPTRIADIQPRFLVGDFPWVEERLGEKRMKLAYAWKTLQASGVICAGGSDSPVEPLNPLLGIHAAVTRRAPGETHNGWYEQEKMTMIEAFRLFTELGAYPTNEETIKGTIARGKLADMVVFSKDPFEMENPDELLDTEVEMTIIGGEVKYKKED
ncbi:hydrolase [Virgibacillus halodenitrificans]|uniref:Hydrolase n=1 Tax=Virgibacillus halodenitrificans TaxID=1482 RepID=A0AAC9NL91_VIRHA|nr:amidohydrolase [Virgibacillus halodenitrificans]APC49252.1 hydrolase [Virgibacillus halodenitrificans]CDQ30959.1 N-substituted formamide deformylase precursor [Virgibacillus halodenitrificans]